MGRAEAGFGAASGYCCTSAAPSCSCDVSLFSLLLLFSPSNLTRRAPYRKVLVGKGRSVEMIRGIVGAYLWCR